MFTIAAQPADFLSASNYETALQNPLREVVGKQYRMAHHNSTNWERICQELRPIAEGEATLEDVGKVISFFINDEQFQSKYRRRQKTEMTLILDEFFNSLTQQEKIFYQTTLLPSIAQLILQTEELFPLDRKISMLTQYENETITLSKKQCACLIAHMAFCIIVDQAEGFKLPELIDLSVIYLKPGLKKFVTKKIQKMRCIFTYFEKVLSGKENLEENVHFERLYVTGTIHHRENWERCGDQITEAQILSEGCIEDIKDSLQVVFSDKELGDQVLQLSATQQQIMSLIHPELMVSILFCEEIEGEEAIRVTGAGRYSNYRGYSDTFEFTGPYVEEKKDAKERQHVIMDAEKYNLMQAISQFDETWILRELKKAYSGFIEDGSEKRVATGKWGCGVFKGNPQLKFIVQWLAASRAGREILFYSFGDAANFVMEETQKILNYYTGREVRELFEDLMRAAMEMQTGEMKEQTIEEEVVREENQRDDESKNLFKVLIAMNDL